MSVLKTFILSVVIIILCFIGRDFLQEPVAKVPFATGSDFANQDKAYQFDVLEDGQMMRFEIKGTVLMNSWKAMDMEVYHADGTYLFSYRDDLWAESGRDSDGAWTETKKHATFDIRFAKKGTYHLYLTDSSSSRLTTNTKYYFRVVPIRGDVRFMKPIAYSFVFIAIICLVVLGHRLEEGKPLSGSKNPITDKTKPSRLHLYAWCFSLGLVGLVFTASYANDDDEINYASYALTRSNMEVDRSIRQQSLSGANFRAGSARGGK
ncbi:hypothetical protein ACSLBF_18610 (plasmid) [Pseudoalteromonas sp. T1lg65]|uniref:hypothetical protein n=1 Tax=Pseudoalteromonas sp. T1lg65 TaxID=2077101 RepID=UPI003F78E6EC